MKVMHYRQAGAYEIVTGFTGLAPDPEGTVIKAAPFLTEGMAEAQIEAVLREHTEYRLNYENAHVVEDSIAEDGMQKLKGCEAHQALTTALEYIPDYTGTEYWIKAGGAWSKEAIAEPGIELPGGAVPADALMELQNKQASEEIKNQLERQRIAALTSEKKEEEKAQRLKAAARKVLQDAETAELMGEPYDKGAEYAKEKTAIEEMYSAA
jgi:hypothetical protein